MNKTYMFLIKNENGDTKGCGFCVKTYLQKAIETVLEKNLILHIYGEKMTKNQSLHITFFKK